MIRGQSEQAGDVSPNRDAVNALKENRLLSLLAAVGLLYVAIDRAFFDRIVGDDPLSWILRILNIVACILLSAISVSVFVVAWRGRFPVTATTTNSNTAKLMTLALSAAPSALVFGFCLVHTLKHVDSLYLTVMVLFGASLIADLLWTRQVVRRSATGEIANRYASQFLWSCIFFSMLSFMFGMAVSGYVWIGRDLLRIFGVVFGGAMMAVAIYPVHRDAKLLADAVASSQITSVQRDQVNK
jgi:hypothetical protein